MNWIFFSLPPLATEEERRRHRPFGPKIGSQCVPSPRRDGIQVKREVEEREVEEHVSLLPLWMWGGKASVNGPLPFNGSFDLQKSKSNNIDTNKHEKQRKNASVPPLLILRRLLRLWIGPAGPRLLVLVPCATVQLRQWIRHPHRRRPS